MRRFFCLVLVLATACGGCGSSSSDRPLESASLLLDFTPNAVHSGIYTALARDYDEAEGVELKVRPPGNAADSVKLLTAGRVDFAILDIHDLGLARQAGQDVVGVAALVQRPLAAVMALPDVSSPAQLENERVGVSGLPSDEAVLRSVVAGAGGNPDKVRMTTIGFEAVPALLARRVQAATAFWNVEGVELARRRPGIKEFRVDDFGAPTYPELVLCARRSTIGERGDVVRALVTTLQRGYREAQNDPDSAVEAMLSAEPSLKRDSLLAQMEAVAPAFTAGVDVFGELDRARLVKWLEWDVKFGILEPGLRVDDVFAFGLVPPRVGG